ncbi:MAG: hypothetical protein PHC88_13175 [Terrimicrobiaceae bacterium]|nr:hypothetical protein [Terrimicrobiaceae bacterium]
MDSLWPIIAHPFTWGLALGLLVAGFVAKSAWTARGHFKRETARLQTELDQMQKHIHTHLKITASGSDRLEKELADLKSQNENLRVNLSALQQRPGRAEARQLQAYEAAVARMREQAPGFAQAWEQALRQATTEQEAAESGLARLMRKVIPGASAASADPPPRISSGETPTSGVS